MSTLTTQTRDVLGLIVQTPCCTCTDARRVVLLGSFRPQVVAHYFPKLVELHNYTSANAVSQKIYNWKTLNEKVWSSSFLQVAVERFPLQT